MQPNNPDGIIRITRDEAASSEVDDLLKRQMSMRGDPGVTRSRSRQWYYQSWFVFLIVGLLGALMAWAIIEPYFDDQLYFQGEITEADISEASPKLFKSHKRSSVQMLGSIVIRGEKVFLSSETKELKADGSKEKLDAALLQPGQTIGIYLHFSREKEQSFGLVTFVVTSPKPQSPAESKKTLEQLAARSSAAGLLVFPLVAGFIGLMIGAVDGLICRLPRRALLCGLVGLLVGFIGGFISSILAGVAYEPLTKLAMAQADSGSLSVFGFILQMIGRSLAWALAGIAMGLGQGIALRSKRLLLYGLLGGIVGGLLGGMLFDPIDMILLGTDKPSAHWSRLIGFCVIGAAVGASIGIVELLARDAWLRMTQGPLTGKEFLLFKDVMNIGSSPRSDIYLFNDSMVAQNHAVIRAVGDECEIEARQDDYPIFLNNRPLRHARLRHGDQVTIGRTIFVFQKRKS